MATQDKSKMSQSLQQNLQSFQKLMLLPHMKQAFTVLQMPIMELSQLVLNEIEQNPLLEPTPLEFEASEKEPTDERVSDKLQELYLEDPSFTLLRHLNEEFSTHLSQNEDFATLRTQEALEKQNFLDSLIAAQEDPHEVLMSQLREKINDPALLKTAECLLGYFNEHGYIDTPLEEIAALHDATVKDVYTALEILQELEPPGIGARNIQECLSLQLKRKGKEGGLGWKMVQDHWEDMLHHRIPILAKNLKVTCEEIEKVLHEEIRPLQVHPYSALRESTPLQLVPDVTLRYEEDKPLITINEESLPPFIIQPQYRKLIKECMNHRSPIHNFVRTHFSSLKWLTKMLHQRHQTLFRIVSYLSEKQRSFFTDGQTHLDPMTMQEVARTLELHESTIARAVANKYIDSPRGLMLLRHFFTHAYTNQDGSQLSSSAVLDAISSYIDQEDKKHPLSDAKITSLLKERGITCARRTVAKHRSTLKIGNVQQRRHYNNEDVMPRT